MPILNKINLFDKLNLELSESEKNAGLGKSKTLRAIIIIVTILVCGSFFAFPYLGTDSSVSIGSGYTWTSEPLIAEYSFPIYISPTVYAGEVEKAKSNTPPVFLPNNNSKDEAKQLLKSFKQTFSESHREMSAADLDVLFNSVSKFIQSVYTKGFIDTDLADISQNVIMIDDGKERFYVKKSRVTDRQKAELNFDLKYSNLFSEQILSEIKSNVIELLQANYLFNSDLSAELIEINVSSVPRSNGIVRKGDIIIKRGELLSDEHLQKLNSYNKSQLLLSEQENKFIKIIGHFGHVFVVLLFLLIYLFKISDSESLDNFKFSLLCSLVIFSSLFAWASVALNYDVPIEYLILIPTFSMFAAVIFDFRTAFYLTVTMSLLISGVRSHDYELGISMMLAGFLAIYSVREIQNRAQIYKSILLIFIGFLLPIVFFGMEQGQGLYQTVIMLIIAAVNSAASPLITFGLIYIVEKTSNITTDLAIQELDDLNHPLLAKMNELAPGTYQHSLGVAMLSERSARAIGANQLFCRVASYFHDIGKIEKPEYFAENQIDMENKHNLITPAQSSTIIKNHVIHGAQLGKQFKLPQRIIDIIYMHHGTSVMQHFYAKAVEKHGRDVKKEDYQYPGPKPSSKEAAIIMICDAAEAISRLENKTIDDLSNMIDLIVSKLIDQGQFDDANITMSEIAKIKQVTSKNLLAMGHKRVEYKTVENLNVDESKPI